SSQLPALVQEPQQGCNTYGPSPSKFSRSGPHILRFQVTQLLYVQWSPVAGEGRKECFFQYPPSPALSSDSPEDGQNYAPVVLYRPGVAVFAPNVGRLR